MAALVIACGMYCIGAKADDSIRLGMDQYKTENGKVIIYVNHNKGNDFNIDTNDSSVVVGKQELKIEKIGKFSDAKENVSYMFMVDISGSMSKDRIDTIKATLKEFISAKKSGDNICISTMAEELVSTGFTEDAATLNSFVDGIAVTQQDTDLYKSVKEELNTLKTDKAVHKKRCLVIFSDGAEDKKDGITQSEAEEMVKKTHIPIFTVALLPIKYGNKDIENAKILGSFARYSAGGEHYVPQIDGFPCNEVNGKIKKTIDDSVVVSADLAEVTAQDGNIYLGVKFSYGSEKGQDGMEIPVGDILDAIKLAKQRNVNVNVNINKEDGKTEGTTAEVKAPDKKKGSDKTTYIIIGCAVAAMIIIIIVVILLATGKKKEAPRAVSAGNASFANNNENKTIGLGQAPPAPAPAVDNSMYSGLKVTLHKMGPNASEKYPLVLDSKKSIGRKKTCDLSFAEDGGLSGTHCYIYSKGKKIYVQDNNSTNGTFINGVPIKGEFVVESGDTLLIGSGEYRIVQD